MSRLREELADQIARKVQAHGLVVWEDDVGEYRDVAATLVPDGARFEAFDGSWYELRRRIEHLVAAEQPPRLVVYVPAAPADDPLAEVRAAAAEFKRKLSTLVRQALAGQLTETRIADIARKATTLSEAEQAIAGDSDADVRLISLLGSADTARMLAAVLACEVDPILDEAKAWPAVADLCRDVVGAEVAGSGDELRDGLFRHLLLSAMDRVTEVGLPDALTTAWQRPSATQQRRAVELLERLLSAGGGVLYKTLADRADLALSLSETFAWSPGLAAIPGTRALDALAFAEAVRQLAAGEYSHARSIGEARSANSPWVADLGTGWGSRWRAVAAVAQLRADLIELPPPAATAGSLLRWYVDQGWRVDRSHRRLELARTELGLFGELEGALTSARLAYDTWLDTLLNRFTSGLAEAGLDIGDLVRQGEVHDRFVAGTGARTAYVWVDALRYELGVELVEALRPIAESVELFGAVAAAPTITPVGMANLLPDAGSALRVALRDDRILVTIAGTEVKDVPDRRDLLRARHGTVADFDLNDASQKGEAALTRSIGKADLVLLRSQEVDAAGESGMLSVAWAHFETVTNLLASVIARLAQGGIERVVISADHGFIALSQDLGSQRIVDPPAGAAGVVKRRAFIGRGGVPSQATVRVTLAACGVTSDLDLIVPRGLAVFRAGGGRQFFHGGLSPQELVVPVVVVELTKAPEPQKLLVVVQVAGDRITTGVFAATLQFSGNLFTSEVTVRVVATGEGHPVARVVSGDGYDADTGTVTVSTDRPCVLTFQVTGNLAAGAEVDLQVLDARTGRKITASTVAVAAPIRVEDELD